LGDLHVDGRKILKWLLKIYCRLDCSDSAQSPVAACCGYVNEFSGSIKYGGIYCNNQILGALLHDLE
jgi:hypothetical protein